MTIPTHLTHAGLSGADAAGASTVYASASEMFGAAHEVFARASAWVWPEAANHLWQSTLFAALVFAASLALRGAPARARHALWLVAAAKFALPSALFAYAAGRAGLKFNWLAGAGAEAGGAGGPLVARLAEPLRAGGEMAAGVPGAGAAPHGELFCALTLAWVFGATALMLLWVRRRGEFVRALARGREVYSGRAYEALERARASLNLKTDVLLVLTEGPTGPGVWRTRRPVVVLPEGVAERLEDEELESVMTHELAHVERRDNLLDGAQAALACALWFHPPVWLVTRRLRAERERACDERVIEAGGEPRVYASSILKVVRLCLGPSVAGVSAAAAGGRDLRRRIEMIMRDGGRRALGATQRGVLCALAAAGLGLTVCAGLVGRGAAAGAQGRGGGAVVVSRQDGVRGDGPATKEVEQAPEAVVQFDNAPDTPAQITGARMRLITGEQLRRADEEGADYFDEGEPSDTYLTLPTVTLTNVSGREIREIGVGYVTAASKRVSVVEGRRVTIRPGESATLESQWARRNVIIPGGPADVSARVVWVAFADGTHWGGRDTRVQAPPPPPRVGAPRVAAPPPPPDADEAPDAPDEAQSGGGSNARGTGGVAYGGATASGGGSGAGYGAGRRRGEGSGSGSGSGVRAGGGLDGQKLYAPPPSYLPIAKAAGAEGVVSVRVTVDEDGRVVSAEAVSGHPLLRDASVEAARASRFRPTLLEGRPVKVSGVISYVFRLDK